LSRRQLRSSGLGSDSAGAAVVANVIYYNIVDNRFAVNVRDICGADVVHRPVVEEVSVIPVAASIAESGVPESVTDAAVESDRRTPEPGVPQENSVTPAPITWGP
jgi:hypothetical protein